MSFRAFISKFKPPLGDNQIDAIVEEHTRLVEKAVEDAKKEWRKKRRRKPNTLRTVTETEEE